MSADLPPEFQVPGVLGRNSALARVLREAEDVARLDVPVLLTGPPGAGKSLLARVIHANSPRRGGKLVEIHCAALPEALAESEIFGQRPGCHSRCSEGVVGAIASAERGTVFLDEITVLSPAVQVRLLQLLQSRTYCPLGSPTPVLADVRVIAAASADLQAAVAAWRFRSDLHDRLRTTTIYVPSLDEGREDVADLVHFFCAWAAERAGVPQPRLSPELHRALEDAEWPGGMRQLELIVMAAVMRAAREGSAEVEVSHAFPDAANAAAEPDARHVSESTPTTRRPDGAVVSLRSDPANSASAERIGPPPSPRRT